MGEEGCVAHWNRERRGLPGCHRVQLELLTLIGKFLVVQEEGECGLGPGH